MEIRTETIEVPVIRPLPDELLRDHRTPELPAGDELTVESLSKYVFKLIETIELYRSDKQALRDLVTPEQDNKWSIL